MGLFYSNDHETIESKRFRRRFAIVTCLGLMFGCLIILVHYSDRSTRFADHGVRTKGKVVSSTSEPCGLLSSCGSRFSYRIMMELEFSDLNGERRVIVEKRVSRNPRPARIGKTYTVWYLRNDPSIFYLGSKGVSDRAWFLFKHLLVLAMFLFAGAAAWFYLAYSDEDFPPPSGDNSWFWID